MVAKKPEDRYQSVTALVADLARRSAPRDWRRLRVAALAVLLAAAGTWGTVMLSRSAFTTRSRCRNMESLDLPVKPTWRTTGEYPLIAGRWCEWEERGVFVDVRQYGDEFVATTTYKEGDEEGELAMDGRISKSGHLTAKLVHVQPHPPDKWLPQTRTAILEPDGKSVHGYADWGSGGSRVQLGLAGASGSRGEGDVAMKRRAFLAACLCLLPCSAALAGEHKRFVFRIKTKSGSIVGNIVIEAKDIEEAKHKLRQRYPDCEILEGREKK